jgi:hypothetical protein
MTGIEGAVWIPIIVSALGGICVGQVTKVCGGRVNWARRITDAHPSLRQSQLAGGVRKSFSLVAGIMLTGLLDVVVLDAEIKCVAQHAGTVQYSTVQCRAVSTLSGPYLVRTPPLPSPPLQSIPLHCPADGGVGHVPARHASVPGTAEIDMTPLLPITRL